MAVLSELLETYRIPVLLLLGSSIFFFVQRVTRPRSKASLPVAGTWYSDPVIWFLGSFKFLSHAKSMLDSGYSKHPDTLFQIPTFMAVRLIIPPKYVEELRNYPDSKLSFTAYVYESLHLERVGLHLLSEVGAPHTKVARLQLTSNLAKLVGPINDEAKYAFHAEIGPAKEWKAIPLHPTIVRIVARVSSRVFVGEGICRNDDWIRISTELSRDVFRNALLMSISPSFLRPLATFLFPFKRKIQRHMMSSRKFLGPVYEQRLTDREAGKPEVGDVFGWIISNAQPRWRDTNDLADFNLFLSLAGLHTITDALVAIIYDLAARPEYIESLREEITQAVTEDGGQLKKSTLAKMMKLDSFMKESQRFNSIMTSFSRKVVESFDLSDGTHIPKGSRISASAISINFDPKYYEDPEAFDGYRFYKLRQQAGEFNKHQYVSTSLSEINFGYGSQACPGRFFAANEIQLVLVRLLMKYDFKYPEGEGRPKNKMLAEENRVDVNRNMLLKERAATEVPGWDFL